jgi:lipopolysaccharide/colanic/teichoic acid biosynthesis glycosyltransferase
MYKGFIKPAIDFLVALICLLCLSPVIIIVAVLLYVNNKGSVFYFQDRPGKNRQTIKIIKFKSMNDKRDAAGKLLPDVERITKLGAFIRKTSMDELPQLINVLMGDMSLVGPRPLLFKYVALYSPEQNRRHDVKPGITGWAQVNGRNSISWTEKFKYDIYYVDNISLALDIKILWLTFLKVIKREGVNQSEERPMLPFNGYN